MSDIESAKHQITVWGMNSSRTKDEILLASLTISLLESRGLAALTDPSVIEIIARAQMTIACGWTPSAMKLFCDGSCINNGAVNARAGYGVYVTRDDDTEIARIAQKIPADQLQTNQRAELLALRHALTYFSESGASSATIFSDSRYAIDCISKWSTGWMKAGWRKADKKPIQHLDIIKPTFELWTSLKDAVRFEHVAAHTGGKDFASRGNAIADELANIGASIKLP